MNRKVFLWGIILLAGFIASYALFWNRVSEAWIWISWAIIFNVGHYFVWVKAKKTSRGVKNAWLQNGVVGFLITIIISLGIINISYGFLMSMWFLLIGSVMLAASFEKSDSLGISTSIIFLITSIFSLAFGNSYFLAGLLILGLLTAMNGIFLDR